MRSRGGVGERAFGWSEEVFEAMSELDCKQAGDEFVGRKVRKVIRMN
tara:strand:- start:6339 stop:6479 length:141 start_codon:yes stop_codon:yes gene_type:complete